ncbi:MAG: biotin--[acetyl-CoA-carboxylase] ligase [Candidatus Hydrogenedentota bacterium]
MYNFASEQPLFAQPLHTRVVGSRILVFDTVDSTSTRALNTGGDGTVVVADHQTQGRGRHGRLWHSAPGLGLWFSVAFKGAMDGLAFAAPLAVRDGLRAFCSPTVKWPNDLLLDKRKFCGILVENRSGTTAVGIGLNMCHREEDFPPEVRSTATSLFLATAIDVDRGKVLRRVLTALDERVCALRDNRFETIRREWVLACNIEGRRVRYQNLEGFVTAIDGRGGLVLDTPEGVRRVLFGERIEWLEDEPCCL